MTDNELFDSLIEAEAEYSRRREALLEECKYIDVDEAKARFKELKKSIGEKYPLDQAVGKTVRIVDTKRGKITVVTIGCVTTDLAICSSICIMGTGTSVWYHKENLRVTKVESVWDTQYTFLSEKGTVIDVLDTEEKRAKAVDEMSGYFRKFSERMFMGGEAPKVERYTVY